MLSTFFQNKKAAGRLSYFPAVSHVGFQQTEDTVGLAHSEPEQKTENNGLFSIHASEIMILNQEPNLDRIGQSRIGTKSISSNREITEDSHPSLNLTVSFMLLPIAIMPPNSLKLCSSEKTI